MIRMKMPPWFRRLLYLLIAFSLCSGVGFFVLNNWVTVEGEFGPEKHPAQFPLLKIHGAAAFAMMLSFGAILGAHIPASWRTGRSRRIGLTLTTVVSLQVLSAWLLYYMADEAVREWVVYLHLGLGVFLPLWLSAHILLGKRARH